MARRTRQKLTATFVSSPRAPDPTGRQTFYWDSELRGFGVLVSGTTKAKSYVLQGTVRGGKQRRITLGSAYLLTADEARRQAKIKLGEMQAGIDPAEAEREQTNASVSGGRRKRPARSPSVMRSNA